MRSRWLVARGRCVHDAARRLHSGAGGGADAVRKSVAPPTTRTLATAGARRDGRRTDSGAGAPVFAGGGRDHGRGGRDRLWRSRGGRRGRARGGAGGGRPERRRRGRVGAAVARGHPVARRAVRRRSGGAHHEQQQPDPPPGQRDRRRPARVPRREAQVRHRRDRDVPRAGVQDGARRRGEGAGAAPRGDARARARARAPPRQRQRAAGARARTRAVRPARMLPATGVP